MKNENAKHTPWPWRIEGNNMERIYMKILKEIEHGNYRITESGALTTDYGWIYEDMAHDHILRLKVDEIRRKLPKSGDLSKAFVRAMDK